ncbi:AP-3 complex subunit beta-2-like [Tigriopus californicus]|uniref:AP-3 complex subunit beta-2-like n=1 Tax=Tigriopus californicus TaxID=6832 RepID=UPI0027D9F6CE|nr:AP-3 complex subunit beta-2-like [Tigriopus californicus]
MSKLSGGMAQASPNASYHQSYGDGGAASPASTGSTTGFGSQSGVMEAVEMDPASGASIFHADGFKKHEDLKQMLDSNKDSLKLEAMKRIIHMVARGKDASDLFPAVVKNVVSKNIEIKKLVYVYLTRYAEEQQDVALLSISTFQRALKDPNQLIRASALRVLSSIRVTMIVPIMMLAIRDSAVDMSAFVRKTAAHAIPKLYSLDPDQKDELVNIIEKLLGDRTTLVVGSAVMAFEEVCPERIELIHKNFRKLCNLLVDVEEWGQVVIIGMLTRYARTQFLDPNAGDELDEFEESSRDFYASSEEEDRKKTSSNQEGAKKRSRPKMDPDHRLLFRSTKPLLQSRNASVVMATAQLYHHTAPKAEVQVVAKALIRLLRSHKEIQAVVLNCIASMTSTKTRNNMFEPHLRNFFVRSSDPTHIKILKLEIITNLANAGNIGIILREFQSYITSQDKFCIAATIQAIGRCASTIDEVTDTCLNGLVHLLSNRDQAVVAESVVVIKKLLQSQTGDHKEIITHMAKLVDSIQVPAARAAIVWVLGEYCERVPKIAPDVLRKMAKSFVNETPEVKTQTLNLALKLCLTNPGQTKLIAQYVFNLARYDQNYDIRDRARFMRVFVFPPPGHETNKLLLNAKNIFLATKPPPVTESKFKDREVYQLGSLSHFLNIRANGYQDLPSFPDVAPDSSLRNVEPIKVPNPWEKSLDKLKKKSTFYSESDGESGTSDSSSSSSGNNSSESSSSEDESDHGDASTRTLKQAIPATTIVNGESKKAPKKDEEEMESSSESSDESSSSESSSSEDETYPSARGNRPAVAQSNLDLLLDLSEAPPASGTPMLTPSIGGFLSPSNAPNAKTLSESISEAEVNFYPTKSHQLLSKMSTGGLQVSYRFTRSSLLYSSCMCNVELTLSNLGDAELIDVKIGAKQMAPGMSLKEFPGIASMDPGQTAVVNVGIDFNDTTQGAKFSLVASGRCFQVTLNPIMGELVKPVSMPEGLFNLEQGKLKGMNETETKVTLPEANANLETIKKKIFEGVNVAQVPSSEDDTLKFVAKTLSAQVLVLIRAKFNPEGNHLRLNFNCEKIVVGSMLGKELKVALEST